MDSDGVFARLESCPRATERRPLKVNQTFRELCGTKESDRTREELPAGNSVRFTTHRRAAPICAGEATTDRLGHLSDDETCRQVKSRKKGLAHTDGDHFAEARIFRPGTRLTEKVVPSLTVTNTLCP